MDIDGAFLLGLAAMITSLTGSIVTIVTLLRRIAEVKEHVDGRFDELQATNVRKSERNLVMEGIAQGAGAPFPPDRTDIPPPNDVSHVVTDD